MFVLGEVTRKEKAATETMTWVKKIQCKKEEFYFYFHFSVSPKKLNC